MDIIFLLKSVTEVKHTIKAVLDVGNRKFHSRKSRMLVFGLE